MDLESKKKDGRKVWKVDKHDLLTHQKEKTCSRLRPNVFFRSLKKKSNFRAKIRHCCSRAFGFAIFLPRVNARRKTQSKISRATMSNFGSQIRFFSFSTRSKKPRLEIHRGAKLVHLAKLVHTFFELIFCKHHKADPSSVNSILS